jgi:hypothetical protein
MLKLNYDKFTDFIDVFERRSNLWIFDSDSLFEKLNENFNEKILVDELKKNIKRSKEKLPIKFQNAQISTFSKALINYLNDDGKMIQGYTTLTKFCKNKDFRIANIKQLLQDKGYLIKNYATEKAFVSDNLHLTIKNHVRKSGLIDKIDLFFLWKESFLNDLVSRNKSTIIEYSLDYKYRTPRSQQENLNEIYKYAKLLYNSEFVDSPFNDGNDYDGKYPFIEFFDGSTDIIFMVSTLNTVIKYKYDLLTDEFLKRKFLIEFNILSKYIDNYRTYYG